MMPVAALSALIRRLAGRARMNGSVLWETGNYRITREVFERGLGLVFLIAFLCALNQFIPLLGEHGLEPVPLRTRAGLYFPVVSLDNPAFRQYLERRGWL